MMVESSFTEIFPLHMPPHDLYQTLDEGHFLVNINNLGGDGRFGIRASFSPAFGGGMRPISEAVIWIPFPSL